jgi:hypothetical protein
MGWPVLGHIPTLAEAIGLTLAIVGLLVTSLTECRPIAGALKRNFQE